LQYLYLDNNRLESPFPDYLLTKPNINYINLQYNGFSCPLPQWCDAPPKGNGLCTPCSNTTTTSFRCCYYQNNDTNQLKAMCVQGDCPLMTGWTAIASTPINSCDNCKLGKRSGIHVNPVW